MSKFKQHFFVCTNQRPPFAGASCGPQGGQEIVMRFLETVEQKGLQETVKVTPCGCLGPCENGPMIVVYPEAVWYAYVTPGDVEEIVESHAVQGKPVQRLLYEWPEQET